jgi:hypothetical protein
MKAMRELCALTRTLVIDEDGCYDIELIAPHKRNRKHITQDGRPFRPFRRRSCAERLFAWLRWPAYEVTIEMKMKKKKKIQRLCDS